MEGYKDFHSKKRQSFNRHIQETPYSNDLGFVYRSVEPYKIDFDTNQVMEDLLKLANIASPIEHLRKDYPFEKVFNLIQLWLICNGETSVLRG